MYIYGFPGGSDGKESAARQETQVQFSGQKDPLEQEMATCSSILAWRIPLTEEPGGLQSMGLQRVWHEWVSNTFTSCIYYNENTCKRMRTEKGDSGTYTSLALSNQLISCSPWAQTSHLPYLHPYIFLLPHLLYWRMWPSFLPSFVHPPTFITPLCSRGYTSEMNKILYLEIL